MKLDPFVKYQKSDKAYMCINSDHAMPLVAMINLDDEIELKCFVRYCDFKIKPGLNMYEKVLKEYYND